ncbi:carbon-nitrogen hydrolase family protein [Amycolatopsis thermalba]|uniref:Carbon-nitrogen hydrolase family protein n=1 Tax=Amycolatopsis thermalba TaxID=944492 RepID=A0ABY4P2T4_9PSEU|nr:MULTISPECIES: carbon-nitrogen hydrolase family protein [Amycolatopsis]UQS26667.1 carbon-nitrogen hydrolase family protein [Amycolatopsis thermalba]
MRVLPVLMAQTPPMPPGDAVARLHDHVLDQVGEFPGTRLVVYPEFHTCGTAGSRSERHRQYEEMAEPLDGPRVRALRDIAREAGVWLIPGTVVERGPRGELFNTALAIAPDGTLAARYRKIFPWRPVEPFTPGAEFVTFDIPEVGRLGLAVCYDLWFPEVIRQLAWLGAECVVLPTQTSTTDREQELVLARAAAIQNQVFVLSVNASGPVGTGRTIAVDPEGLVRCQTSGSSPETLTDVLDLDAVTRVRAHGTCGLNRMWSQARPGDPVVPLPLYDGRIEPSRWEPLP